VSEVIETWLRQQVPKYFIKLDLCVPEKVHAVLGIAHIINLLQFSTKLYSWYMISFFYWLKGIQKAATFVHIFPFLKPQLLVQLIVVSVSAIWMRLYVLP